MQRRSRKALASSCHSQLGSKERLVEEAVAYAIVAKG
jgi:hypothetical protein